MQFFIDEQVVDAKWKLLLQNSSFSSPFQSPEFYHLFNNIEGFSSNVFAVEVNNSYASLIVVTIQKEKGYKEYFSRRGIIYGGPLTIDANVNYLKDLLLYINKFYYNKLIFLEIRSFFNYCDYSDDFYSAKWRKIAWLNYQKNITTINIAQHAVSNSRMRQIRKALKGGVEWREAKNEDEVLELYSILSELYKRIRRPLFPLSFFLDFLKANIGVILLVYYKERIIGGIICPVMQGKTIYELYVCGLDLEYKDQYPSVIATWSAIDYGIQNNIPRFDFMGAGSPNKDYGVREFKARFGGELVDHGRYIKVLNPALYFLGHLVVKVVSHIKK